MENSNEHATIMHCGREDALPAGIKKELEKNGISMRQLGDNKYHLEGPGLRAFLNPDKITQLNGEGISVEEQSWPTMLQSMLSGH